MRTAAVTPRSTPLKPLQFQSFQGFPCGCVAAVYRVPQMDVEVELVEARGPHCLDAGHQVGRVVRLGHPAELEDAEGPDEPF